MINEHLHYQDGKVDFTEDVKSTDKELQEFREIKNFNLSETHDKFYNQHIMSDYGQIARSTTELIQNLKKATPTIEAPKDDSDQSASRLN